MPKKEKIPVDIKTLIAIGDEIRTYQAKLNSIIEDHYEKIFRITDEELLPVLEMKVSCQILFGLVDEMIEDATTHGVSKIPLFEEEITLLVSLSRMVSSFFKTRPSPRFSVLEH